MKIMQPGTEILTQDPASSIQTGVLVFGSGVRCPRENVCEEERFTELTMCLTVARCPHTAVHVLMSPAL